jgi:death on curing protein
MRYLTTGDVLTIHEHELGREAVVEFGLLEAAVLRPQATVAGQDAYPDIHLKAAAFFHSLLRTHPFMDGNKRTGALSMIVFYNLNGWEIELEQGRLVALALDTAEGLIGVDQIAKQLEAAARPIRVSK